MSDLKDRIDQTPSNPSSSPETPLQGGVLNWMSDHRGRIGLAVVTVAAIGGAYHMGTRERQPQQNSVINPGTAVVEQSPLPNPSASTNPGSVAISDVILGKLCSVPRSVGDFWPSGTEGYNISMNTFLDRHGVPLDEAKSDSQYSEWGVVTFQRVVGHKGGYGLLFQDLDTKQIEIVRVDETMMKFDGRGYANVYIPLDGTKQRVTFIRFHNDLPYASIKTDQLPKITTLKAAGQGGAAQAPCSVPKD